MIFYTNPAAYKTENPPQSPLYFNARALNSQNR
jgi:hypothetical protein